MIGPLGDPFNQSGDDVTFVPLKDGEEGYLTSDREGGEGLDDIWIWRRSPEPLEGKILVLDECTGLPVPDANVSVELTKAGSVLDMIYKGDQQDLNQTTGADGTVDLTLVRESEYEISVEKPEYTPVPFRQ